MRLFLVDYALAFPLFIVVIFNITENEDKCLGLTGQKFKLQEVGCHGAPAVGDASESLSGADSVGVVEAVIKPEEGLAVGVEPVDGPVYMIEGIMIAPFLILSLMIDGLTVVFNLHLAGREIALEILHIGLRVPKTPFLERP